MKKYLITLLGFALFAKGSIAAVTGFAFLNNQIDNSGIVVKFLPQSGTAILDSTVTLTDGSYSINLSGGLYKVLFTKQGYQDLFYQNSNQVALANNDLLQSVTLYSGTVKFITGNVEGIWSSDTIYVTADTIRVLSGNTLTIEPGTTVRVNDNFKFVIMGTLNAIGTDSQKIVFTSANKNPVPGSWIGLECRNNSKVNAAYCLFEYAHDCIYSEYADITVANSELRYFRNGGIYCLNRSPRIFNNNFHSYRIGGEAWTWGIYATGFSLNAFISCNTFDDGKGYGIIIDGYGDVRNNIIKNINGADRGKGISVGIGSSAHLTNNYITNCQRGINTDAYTGIETSSVFVNNTITHCTEYGIWFYDNYAKGNLTNNILSNNAVAIASSSGSSGSAQIFNNIFWNNNQNFININIPGIGQIVNSNNNGDAIDSYFNLFQDPEFVIASEPELSLTSPCINAGDSMYNSSIGFSPDFTCDTVAFVTAISLIDVPSMTIFPNPATDELFIRTLDLATTEINIYSITGSLVLSIKPSYNGRIDISQLMNGAYVVEIKNNKVAVKRKFIKI